MKRTYLWITISLSCSVCFPESFASASCGRSFLSDREFLQTLELPPYEELVLQGMNSDAVRFVGRKYYGEKYDIVIRFANSKYDRPDFEAFASLFVRRTGLSQTPAVVTRDLGMVMAQKIGLSRESVVSLAIFRDGFRNAKRAFGNVGVRGKLSSEQSKALADFWALSVLLGIRDLHPENWGVDRAGNVIGVDLAFRTKTFSDGLKGYPEYMRDPLRGKAMTEESKQFLLGGISSEMREFLRNIRGRWIQEIARESGYRISVYEKDGILRRARFLLREISRNRQ